jgi:AcrR family transcriptional regulator
MSRATEIRDAALELFVERGYEATTMADIGAAVGIRGPSLYKHVAAKQDLLAAIVTETMAELLAAHRAAVTGVDSPTERLRRAVDAHVRYHARHRREAFVGTRELRSLVEPHRAAALAQRAEYAQGFETVVADGVTAGEFHVANVRYTAWAILDLGMGVAIWFSGGNAAENEVAWHHVDLALRMVCA